MKQKTNKAAKKRFARSAKGKIKHRPVHQSHFNGKDSGDQTRRKHKDHLVNSADSDRIQELLPNW